MTELQWRELVDETAKGDNSAFEKLYNETKNSVYFTALKLLANEDDAKDVMQDTFITAIEKLRDLEDGAKFPKWVNTIAVNKCRRYFRKAAEDSIEEQTEQGFEIKDDESFIPEEYVTDEAKRGVVMDIITKSLSDVQRQTIIMYYYDEMSQEDISDAMECPVKTVSSRLVSAREKIREAVLIYEKKHGDRLHAIAPVPILTMILRMEAQRMKAPDIPIEVFTQVLLSAAAKATATSAAAGTAAGSTAAGTTAATTTAAATAAGGGSAVTTSVVSGKLIAGILAVTIAGGGTAAAVIHNNNKKAEEERNTSSAAEISIDISENAGTVTEFTAASPESQTENTNAVTETAEPVTAEVPSDDTSEAEYVEKYEEMSDEMKARLEAARASGEEPVELKWGVYNPTHFIDSATGEQLDIKYSGVLSYYPAASGVSDEKTVNAYVLVELEEIFYEISGSRPFDALPSMTKMISNNLMVRVAENRGLLLESFQIQNLDEVEGSRKAAASSEAAESPKTETSKFYDLTVSGAVFTPSNEVMSDEMTAKLESARASGEEPAEVKWGFPAAVSFTDGETGERLQIKVMGTIKYYPSISDESFDENIRIMVNDTMKELLSGMSGNFGYDSLMGQSRYLSEQTAAILANKYGVAADSITIANIVKAN